ncbi:uncharacterized protein MYCFIDRAFT_208506 [Pseudocercospora fijiensis CIRAD86]|uniref:Uncharacterized protein n=1 Tax=Pseudocercospora fijiensis (strain CIRAD86) TaxID=383855 RepID=M3ASR3_PSEFD|nr:uncharacterized protein MYCFIDRAFT_208506 [Pseudocercospora fijiensis CIRAD86]EME80173.1 hypothetical protein MYCFIDRAFT_208506 [Pseudocercospora fijiensis CIRAD86]
MSQLPTQTNITNHLTRAKRIKSEPPADEGPMDDGSNPHRHSQTHTQRDSNNSSPARTILQPGRGQVIAMSQADSKTNPKKSETGGMEPPEGRSLNPGPMKSSSTAATPRRARRTRDELRELANSGNAKATAELEAQLEKGRNSQRKRKEQAAAGLPSAVASKEKDRKRSQDLSALRRSTAQLKQQIETGDQGAVAMLKLVEEAYLTKYPKSKLSTVSSNANMQGPSGSLQSDKPTKKPAKRKADEDDEEYIEAKRRKWREAKQKRREKLVNLPEQEKEAVPATNLRWAKGRTLRSSHDQHGQPTPQTASPASTPVTTPDATTEGIEPTPTTEPEPPQTEPPEQIPTSTPPTPTPNTIDLEDPDLEFLETRALPKPNPNILTSIHQRLGGTFHPHQHQKNDDDDDVETTKLRIRQKEIEEEKIELQLKLRRLQRSQQGPDGRRDERRVIKSEVGMDEGGGGVGKVEFSMSEQCGSFWLLIPTTSAFSREKIRRTINE